MTKWTHDQLAEALGAIGYEVWMAAGTSVQLRLTPAGIVRNALLESMLLHIRSLHDFFVRVRTDTRDILRTDFVTADWTPGPTQEVARVEAGRDALDKHLAHLSWKRVLDGKQNYDYGQLAEDIVRIAEAWDQRLAVQAPALHPTFQMWVLKARAVITPPSPYTVMKVVTTTSG